MAFRGCIRFLHPDYIRSMHTDDCIAWKKWATESHCLNDRPRVAIPASTAPFNMAPEFEVLLTEWTGLEVLSYLKTNWTHYKLWIEPNLTRAHHWEDSQRRITERLGKLQVQCLDKTLKPLISTTLPPKYTRAQASLASEYSFIDVPNPEDPGWLFLSYLGVSGQPDVDNLVQYLVKVKHDLPSMGDVTNIYRQIHLGHDSDSLEMIR